MRREPLVASARLRALVDRFAGRRVVVLADFVVDEFVYGRVERVSREAPVLILQYEGTDTRLGGGANAVHNIKTLGGRPSPLGVVGRDAAGETLLDLFRSAGVSTSRVLVSRDHATPVKTRVLAGGVHSTKQQIVRMDRVRPAGPRSEARRRLVRALASLKGRVDGVLISDYGVGLLSPAIVKRAIGWARRRKIPVTVDSRHGLLAFHGMTAVTPNEAEVEAALRVRIGNDRKTLEKAGRSLLRRLGCGAVLITRGSDGMALFERGASPIHIPVYGTDEVADVTGAGDTVIAAFTLALASGATPVEAAILANHAGGIVVTKRGTAAVSAAELKRSLS